MVGKELLLFRSAPGRESEPILCLDLPFVLFIPYGRGGEEIAKRVPPASLQLDKRTAETFYEIVVTVQQGPQNQNKHAFPVPISRYDTLSTFGMYNRPEAMERVTDHLVTLGISLPRWSYGPLDPVSVYIKLSPNPDWLSKAKKVTIQSITVGIEEEIIYNHESDDPKRQTKTLARHQQSVGVKMPEAGYFTNLGLVFPAKELRDSEGVLPRVKKEFPMYSVTGFTTTGTLYKIEYYLTVKVQSHPAQSNSSYPFNTNTPVAGETKPSKGHPPPPADRRLPLRPRHMQRGNGGDRTGCQRRRPPQSRQPHATRANHHSRERPCRIESAGHCDDGRAAQTLD